MPPPARGGVADRHGCVGRQTPVLRDGCVCERREQRAVWEPAAVGCCGLAVAPRRSSCPRHARRSCIAPRDMRCQDAARKAFTRPAPKEVR